MHILIVVNSILPVKTYGGTERVVWYLAKELAKRKHKVTFLAKEGSFCPFANIIPIKQNMTLESQVPEDVDIVHFNNHNPESSFTKPCIITQHGNFMEGNMHRNTVFVSRNHAERYGSNQYVYNGMDWDDYGSVTLDNKRSYYHFLGKAAWRLKNVRGAINVVNRLPLSERLYVLGGTRFNIKMGVRLTFSPKVRFFGNVGGEVKNNLLKCSKGLIFPVRWNEPFGIAIIESLYFGAPVFGTPYGSLPELVPEDVGFLTNDSNKMVSHLRENYNYSPSRCHEYARDLFNSSVMADEYIKKYEEILNGHYLNPTYPTSMQKESKNMSWI